LLYRHWRDTVTVDTFIYKMDTTLPSIDDLGLSKIRRPLRSVERLNSAPQFTLRIIDITPSLATIEVDMNTSRSGVFELVNVLGEPMHRIERAAMPQGVSRLTIAIRDIPHGVYYLRASLSDGGIRTVRFVR
jgi:hypothetical protein